MKYKLEILLDSLNIVTPKDVARILMQNARRIDKLYAREFEYAGKAEVIKDEQNNEALVGRWKLED